MNSPAQADNSTAENSLTPLLVSRRRLAFRPPSLLNKKTPSVTSLPTDKTENISSASSIVVSLNLKNPALECVASSSKAINVASSVETTDRTRRMYWTFDEQSVFYEALKLHGKDFDAISKFMLKKKFNKDKDQVRNYYLNTFKVWKCKAQIEDADWENIPRDAKELLVLLNGFEWRKRLKGLPFDEKKFRQLIMEGFSSFRPKRKKFIVNLKTPYCPALLKYFPYDKRNCEIPQHLTVKLKPLRNRDKEFVVASEQNPFLMVQINVNDKIASLFGLIKRKWILKKNAQVNIDGRMIGIRLFVGEGNQIIHNVLVGNAGNSPLLSLNKLKKDFSPNKGNVAGSPIGKQTNEIKLSASSVKEVFEINEDKIRAGLADDEVGNASMLQLFYMLGMKKELSFSYQISVCEPRYHAWTVFKSLVARDYDEMMAKGLLATTDAHNQQSSSSNTLDIVNTSTKIGTNDVISNCVPSMASETIRPLNRRMQCTKNDAESGIVERENAQFVDQLKTHFNLSQERKPKRQIKLVPDNHRKLIRVIAPQQRHQMVRDVIPRNQHPYIPNTAVARPAKNVVIPHQMFGDSLPFHHNLCRVEHAQMVPNTSTDFSILQRSPTAESYRPSSFINCNHTQFVPMTELPSSSAAPNTAIELTLNSELSMDSSTTISQFHPNVLDSSPNKTLPEDVRSACEQMLKENSVDYCRQFEQLASLHNDGSPLKTFEENKF